MSRRRGEDGAIAQTLICFSLIVGLIAGLVYTCTHISGLGAGLLALFLAALLILAAWGFIEGLAGTGISCGAIVILLWIMASMAVYLFLHFSGSGMV